MGGKKMLDLFAIGMQKNSDELLLKYCKKNIRKFRNNPERVQELKRLKKIAVDNLFNARQK